MRYPLVNENVDWYVYNQHQQHQQNYGYGRVYSDNMNNGGVIDQKTNEMVMAYPSQVIMPCDVSNGDFNQNIYPHTYDDGCSMSMQNNRNRFPIMPDNMGYYGDNNTPFPPPCQGPQPWSYAHCYGFYGDPPCQYVDIIDMEDFM